MLPDLPKLKADIAQVFHTFFQHRLNEYLGIVGEVPRSFIKEGKNPVIIRSDGTRDETLLNPVSAETIFKIEEIPFLSVEQRIVRLNEAARVLANKISSHAFETISKAADQAGNVVDAKGMSLNAESIFKVLEKIQLDFEDDGFHHKELTMVIHPTLADRAKDTMEQIHQDPELSKRYKDIIDKKRAEWRDREAARKLVG